MNTSALSLSETLLRYGQKDREGLAIRSADRDYSRAELLASVECLAGNLQQQGLKPAERVGLIMQNSFEAVVAIFAAFRLGACIVPLHLRNTCEDWCEQLKEAGVERVLVDFPQLCSEGFTEIIVKDFLNHTETRVLEPLQDPQAEACILFTSGSTGKQKGVILAQQALVCSALASNQVTGFSEQNCWLLSLPLYHTGGFCILVRALVAGASIEILEHTNLAALARALPHLKSDFISLVPTQLHELIGDLSLVDRLKSFSAILLGGAASSQELVQRIREFELPVLCSYGMTETAAHVTCTHFNDPAEKCFTSGRPIAGVDLKIDESGCLVVRGKCVALGYLGGELFDEEFHTSDLVEIDRDGYLTVLGRNDRVIISGGENISMREIEQLAESVDGIKLAVAIAREDQKWGQRPVLFVESDRAEDQVLLGLKNIFASRLADFKRPDKIIITNCISKNEYGKIDFKQLSSVV